MSCEGCSSKTKWTNIVVNFVELMLFFTLIGGILMAIGC